MKVRQLAVTSTLDFKPTLAFEFYPHGKFKIIQKLCWWILKKTKAITTYFHVDQLVSYHTFDEDQFIDNVIHMTNLLKWHLNYTPTTLIMSNEVFSKMSGTSGIKHYFDFYMDVDRKTYGTLFGKLTVKVVPWIDGWCLI